ncbi:hypothetical protein MSAN_01740700 [Mycena sanguinolenta]|uniref:Uncharacterized protein n=1 Tax=Mycena sanguinolenta TaxID=230812 RepID=A0A8H6XWH2_9AGAR|nr:hypothetical protein MSAN_01740700 [Mycena sanguinolenta]
MTMKLVMSAAQTLWYLGWDGLMTTNLNILLNRRKEIEAEAGHGEAGEYPIWVLEDFEGINKYLAWCPSFADFFECRSGGRGFYSKWSNLLGSRWLSLHLRELVHQRLVAGAYALIELFFQGMILATPNIDAAHARIRLIMHTDDIKAVLEACGLYDDEEFEDDEDEDD